MFAPGIAETYAPISQWWPTSAPRETSVCSPMAVSAPMTAPGPTMQPGARRAAEETLACG